MSRRLLLLLFLGLTLVSRSGLARPLEVVLQVAGARPEKGVVALIHLTSAQPAGGEKPRIVEAKLPGKTALELAAGSAWQVSVEALGYWSRPQVLLVPKEGEGAAAAWTIDLLPAGSVEGKVRVPETENAPKEMTLRFRSAPGAAKPFPEVTESCAVDKARFACAVPVGSFDLRLKAKGFLTHYRWGAAIVRKKALDLGILDLKPGASLVGWIEAPTRDFRFADCSVALEPRTAGGNAEPADLERRGSLAQKATVNSRGFFELDGIAPGSYRVVATHPAYAPTSVAPVQVTARSETEIRAIVLEKPVSFEVDLTPEKDPYGQRWTVELQKPGSGPGQLDTVKKSIASADGVWIATKLTPGRYEIVVTGSYTSRWKADEVEVLPGMGPYEVRLPFVEVEGTVLLGDKPLPYTLLWFGGRRGAVKIPAKSDAQGGFTVTLPEKKESWQVGVVNEPKHIYGASTEVAVSKPLGGGPARVTVTLPDTSVSGHVVDEDGKPVEKARVSIVGPEYLETFAGSPEGDFTILGAKAGKWDLNAEAPDASSAADVISIELGKEPLEDLRLVLHRRQKVAGLIVGPDGEGIPGAAVYARVEQPSRFITQDEPQVYTDVSGKFELAVPAASEALQVTVLPPGFAVRQLRIDPHGTDPILIPVGQVGGTLVLTFAGKPAPGTAPAQYLTSVFHDFQVASTGVLGTWASLNGADESDPQRFRVPMLEPGPYTACFDVAPLLYRTNVLPPGGVSGRCVQGELPPFGELVLAVPVPSGTASETQGAKP